MEMLKFKLDNFSKHKTIRCDVKYWNAMQSLELDGTIKIKDKFYLIPGTTQTQYYTSEITDIPYVRIGDMQLKGNIENEDLIYLNDDCELPDEKILREDDLVIAMIGSTVGKLCASKNVIGGTVSNNISILRKNRDNVEVEFYEMLFQSDLYYNLFRNIASQKAQPNLNEYDLMNLPLPQISFEKIKEVLEKTNPLRKSLLKYKSRKENIKEIIDNALESFFGYDFNLFNELKSNKIQINNLEDFSNNVDLRFSAKYHRKAGIFATDELSKNSVKIKKVLSNISMTGKGISPKDFEEDTECYYITMADISAWEIDYQNLKTVSEDYEDKNSLKKPKGEKEAYSTKVKKGDILMMRSGEGGIGKVALVTQDINAIFSDFIIRFRFDENKYIPKFCYYYMRSKYFQYLVEIHKKGLGNNTNIFPNITNEFPIPNIAKSEQKKIISEIQNHIMQQKGIDRKIESIQKEISDIIEKSIL